jgi:glyoxylase-like metal-dependent hydrolase (beta-lactamase superfamily II)
MYAINSGKEAIVYDIFTSVAHAEFVRLYLEKLGARKFTAVLSHWHLDHIAGSAVFDDCDIIATSLTHDTLKRHTADIEAGTVWGRRPSRRSYPQRPVRQPPGLRVGEIALDLRMSPKSLPIMATRTSSRKGDTIRP